jgi:CheY-like chemotaxis protein
MVIGCSGSIGDSQADGWVYLTLEGPGGVRDGVLCFKHAYCVGSLLGGVEVVSPAAGATPMDPVQPSTRRGPISRILVVDDDAAIRSSLCELLKSEGYDVICASDGQEALAALRTNSGVELILLDLRMPKMDGWSFRRMQRQAPELAGIPVIVMSAASDKSDRALELAADALVRKPIDSSALLGHIELLC